MTWTTYLTASATKPTWPGQVLVLLIPVLELELVVSFLLVVV